MKDNKPEMIFLIFKIIMTSCGFELKGQDISANIIDVENKRYGTPVIEKSLMGAIRQTINIWNGGRSENGTTICKQKEI
jgi:hypothetical protein